MIYDIWRCMMWYNLIYDIWYMTYDTWYDIWQYDMTLYVWYIWYMTWYMIWYMTWYIWYMTWCMIWNMTWYIWHMTWRNVWHDVWRDWHMIYDISYINHIRWCDIYDICDMIYDMIFWSLHMVRVTHSHMISGFIHVCCTNDAGWILKLGSQSMSNNTSDACLCKHC